MEIVVIIAVMIVCAGWIAWRRRQRGNAAVAIASEGRPGENPAHKAFAHGNSCLAAGQLAQAAAAFRQAQELDPAHPHVAGRLAEVERQQAASVTSPDTSSG